MLEQLAGDPRILAGDPVAAAQHIDRAQCDIPKVADRGGDDIEPRCKGIFGRGRISHPSPMNQY